MKVSSHITKVLYLQACKEDEELACHRFAGAFLAPKPAVLQCLGERRSQLELQELYLLKQDWGLSMQAWSYRAHDLGVISTTAFKTLWQTHLRAWKEAEREPGEQYPQENTSLFKQLVYRALAEDRLGESKAAELLGMTVKEFAALRKMEFPTPGVPTESDLAQLRPTPR
jgi:Zn-dependent peptidase ImmA (M78 family)